MSTVAKINNLILKNSGFSNYDLAIIRKTVAKGTTDPELAYFLNVAKSSGLNPFTREIWCYKDNRGNVIVFAGRDGLLSKAQQSGNWNGMTSAAHYENDDFKMDLSNGIVNHFTSGKDRGKLIGAYAIVKPKGVDLPTAIYVDREDYDKAQSVWKTNPAAMLIKCAESHALKKAHGIIGLQVEHDFYVQENGTVANIQEVNSEDEVMRLKESVNSALTINDLKDVRKKYADMIRKDVSLLKLLSDKKESFE